MPKLKQQPKKLARSLYGRLPWYGKILVPVVVLALGVYALDFVAGLFL
ncbi:hypothetical protein [Propionibacterium freudenreichii]|nr:hypothetical protein [Propionibacterium freudenreichii]MDK9333020.1 hypothetical protein [Propionibacterium freudenreichii]CEI49770.1 Protein of unknown function [Propionibacterium freudenreichii]SCQ59956.1 Hypothetical protein PFR_JS9-1_407 [Propionibacterium freudenreichii]SCQ66793.1 Hypothetical protein PFR_JS9-2_405 [Propionibacterium freudenreichii]